MGMTNDIHNSVPILHSAFCAVNLSLSTWVSVNRNHTSFTSPPIWFCKILCGSTKEWMEGQRASRLETDCASPGWMGWWLVGGTNCCCSSSWTVTPPTLHPTPCTLHNTTLYRTILHCTALHCTVLPSICIESNSHPSSS